MLYYMSTKTLVEDYAKVFTPKQVLESTFALFSNRIIPERGIIKIPYNQTVFFALENDNDKNIQIIRNNILDNVLMINSICTLVRKSLAEPNSLNVILSSPREMKTKYPFYLAQTIENMFEYPVIDFKKGKNKSYKYNPKKVYLHLQYYSAYSNKLVFDDNPDRVDELSMKALKNMTKILGLYEKGMTKKEIKEILKKDSRLPFR